MNVLIVANHYPVCSARYAADAFERLGHTVKHVGPERGRDIWGLRLPERYVWKRNVHFTLDHLTSEIASIDLVVIMDSDPQLLDKANTLAQTKVVFGVDNHVRDYRREKFTHYFLAHRNVSQMPRQPDVTHSPCCYDPAWHTPSPIPWAERKYDVAILGMMYPQRMQAVKELQAAGLKTIWGCGAVYETYRDLHHQSRIALNLSANGDVGQRVMETAAMGNLVMSDNCPDYQILKPDGFWLIEGDNPLAEQVKGILAQPDVAQAMLAKSLAWVKPHTWDSRANQIVEWYEGVKINEPV